MTGKDKVLAFNTKSRPDTVREELRCATRTVDETYLEVAKLLHEVKSNEYYRRWEFDTFSDYCETELDMRRSKAYYLARIAEILQMVGGDWELAGRVGWNKMSLIAPLLGLDRDENDRLMREAEVSSYRALRRKVRLTPHGSKNKVGEEEDNRITLPFRFDTDEAEVVVDALESAKKLIGVESDSLALFELAYAFQQMPGEGPVLLPIKAAKRLFEETYNVRITIHSDEIK